MLTESVSYPAALLAGLLSFLSPCVLPLIPAYFTFITGFSLDELLASRGVFVRRRIFFSTLAFVVGFSAVFILMGASASYIGSFVFRYRDIIRVAGGILILILGIHLTGLVRFSFLEHEKRLHFGKKPFHFFGTFVIGMAFGAGWSPCIGPLLGSILVVAGSQQTVVQGMVLLSIYSLGLALPFVVLSVCIHFMLAFLRRATRIMRFLNPAAGALLILIGLLLLTNRLTL